MAFWRRYEEEDEEGPPPLPVRVPKVDWIIKKVDGKVVCEGNMLQMIADLTKVVEDMKGIAGKLAQAQAPEPKPVAGALPPIPAPSLTPEKKAELKAKAAALASGTSVKPAALPLP